MEWRPCIIKNKATGQSVHTTIFDKNLFLSSFWSFDDLLSIYGDDNELFKTLSSEVGV